MRIIIIIKFAHVNSWKFIGDFSFFGEAIVARRERRPKRRELLFV